jgi:ketosteroid isomerase-like protein
MTDTKTVAATFTDLLKAGKHHEASERFWAPDVVSIEAMDGPMARCEGVAAVKAKGEWWMNAHEWHGGDVEGPFVNGDQFAVRFTMDITEKASGKRMQMTEMGLYTVAGGKIVEERFFY